MKKFLNHLHFKNFAIAAIAFLLAIIVFIDNGTNYSYIVLSLNYIMMLFVVYKVLYLNKEPYSLDIIFHLFIFFFFLLAPTIQYKSNTIFFPDESVLESKDFLWGGWLTFFILLGYNFFSYHLKKKGIKKIKLAPIINLPIVNSRLIICVAVLFTTLFLIINKFNFEAVTFRGFKREDIDGIGLSTYEFLTSIIRNIPFILLIYYKIFNQKKIQVLSEIILVLSVIICNFPTGITRLQLAVVYLPILILYVKKLQKGKNFILSFVFGLLMIFPYFHHFRYNLKFKSNDGILNFRMFNELHFDSFQHTLSVIKLNLITYGEQLLGVILFFIPRSFWENKPYSTGHYLGQQLDYSWKKIAVSFFGEGYVNFGFLGILIFIFILSYINVFVDNQNKKSNNLLIKICFLPFLFYEFMILRGSLLSSTSKFCTFVAALCVVVLIFKTSKLKIFSENR